MKTQIGKAFGADFGESTWTFLMPQNYEVAAGEFVIVDKPNWDELIKSANDVVDAAYANGKISNDFADALNAFRASLLNSTPTDAVSDTTEDDK